MYCWPYQVKANNWILCLSGSRTKHSSGAVLIFPNKEILGIAAAIWAICFYCIYGSFPIPVFCTKLSWNMTAISTLSSFKSLMVTCIFAIPPRKQYWFWYSVALTGGTLLSFPLGSYYDKVSYSMSWRNDVKTTITARNIFSNCILIKCGNSHRMGSEFHQAYHEVYIGQIPLNQWSEFSF